MQGIGTLARSYDADIFVKLLASRLQPGGAVIDDLRYRNELTWCRENGFLVVYLLGSYRPLPAHLDAHESEQDIGPDDADLVLDDAPVENRLVAVLSVLVSRGSAYA